MPLLSLAKAGPSGLTSSIMTDSLVVPLPLWQREVPRWSMPWLASSALPLFVVRRI